jgi:Domain of unknown function (DUF4410)
MPIDDECSARTGTHGVPLAHVWRRAIAYAVVVGLALAAISACARSRVEHVRVHASGLPKPELIIVHHFAVSPAEVVLDSGIRARLSEFVTGTPEAEAQLKVAQEVARTVAEHLVEETRKLGMPAVSAAAASPLPGPTLSIEGQFVSIDEGNTTRRMIVGFGAGASEVRTLVQVYHVTHEERHLVEDFYTTVKSSRKPGMGPLVGVGAMAGRAATSAVVSGGVGLATAGLQTVEADARHTATEIAKVLARFFAAQGWIPAQ